jgi:hypothetical protein
MAIRISRPGGALMRSLLVALFTALLLAPTVAQAAPTQVHKPSGELTAVWWQEFAKRSAHPAADTESVLGRCSVNVDDVILLAGAVSNDPVQRSCRIAHGKKLLVPLINGECSTAEGQGETAAELRACARAQADQFTDLFLRIDGVKVADPQRLRVASEPFVLDAAKDNVFGIPAGRTLSVADGYWALIGPLSLGKHTLSFGGAFQPPTFTPSTTYTIRVTGGH